MSKATFFLKLGGELPVTIFLKHARELRIIILRKLPIIILRRSETKVTKGSSPAGSFQKKKLRPLSTI
jgi:hypothetical protein